MADTATTDTSQHMAMIPTVIKSQPMEDTTVTSQAMAKNPMVTKSQLMVGTTTTDTSRPMAKNPPVMDMLNPQSGRLSPLGGAGDSKSPTNFEG